MDAARWQRLSPLLDALLDLPPAERADELRRLHEEDAGLAAELLRLVGIPSLGYVVYYLHLISVAMLFLYMPYTKFAHLVYRTFAMAFERYRDSAFIKNPLNQ